MPQDPNDEPASVLLEKIREEKARLVKEGKLKKKDLEVKPIAEDEIPFEIPKGWEWVRWGDLSESIQYGYNAPAKETGRIKMVRISDIQNGRIVWETTPFCNIEEKEIDTYLLKKNDILFARTGGTVGKSYLVSEEQEEAIYAGYLIRTRYSSLLCAKYLKAYMESSLYWAQLKDGTIATAQPNCNGQTLSKMILPLPPLAEQHRIVAKLEELMPLVEKYGAAQDALEEWNNALPEKLKKSILQEAIQGRLVPQDPADEPASVLLERIRDEKKRLVKEGKLKKKDLEVKPIEEDEVPFEIPESWEWCRIGDLFAHNNGKQLNKGNARGKLMDYITTSNLYWDRFVLDNLKQMPFEENEIERCQAKKGDLLVCEGGDIGRAAIWNKDYQIMLQNHVHKLRSFLPLSTKYFFYLFFYYNQTGMIGGKGIGIQGFSSSALHNTIVPLPPLAEQRRIVAKIEELFGVIGK